MSHNSICSTMRGSRNKSRREASKFSGAGVLRAGGQFKHVSIKAESANLDKAVNVAWSGFDSDKQECIKKMVSFLGGCCVSSMKPAQDLAKYDTITHFLVTADKNQLSRTLKMMTAMAYGVSIVTIVWLMDSFKARKFLPIGNYVPSNHFEMKYNFTFASTLDNATCALKRGGILAGYFVHICHGAAGKGDGKPPSDELKLLLRAAGAEIVPTQAQIGGHTSTKVILLTSSPGAEFRSCELQNAEAAGAVTVPMNTLFRVLTEQSLTHLKTLTPPTPTKENMEAEPDCTLKTPQCSRKPLGVRHTNKNASTLPKSPHRQKNEAKSPPKPHRQPTETPTKERAPALAQKKAPRKPQHAKSNKNKKFSAQKKTATASSNGHHSPRKSAPVDNNHRKKLDAVLTKQGFPCLDAVLKKQGFPFEPSLGHAAGVKDVTQSPSSSKQNDPYKTPKKVDCEADNTEMLVLYKMNMSLSPFRTTSRGKNHRQDLGEDGTLHFFKSALTGRIHVHYIARDGLKMFDAELHPEEMYMQVKGNGGVDYVFSWEALNKSHGAGGTTIKGARTPADAIGLRRVYFRFGSREKLTIALFWLFNQNDVLATEFFKKDGKFTVTKETLPAHFIMVDEDEMDTDDGDVQVSIAPLSAKDVDGYDPGSMSQFV